MSAAPVVLDTNIVLDLFLFPDTAAAALRADLAAGKLRWLSTAAMRGELQRVLGYAHLRRRMDGCALRASDLLERFDTLACLTQQAEKAPVTCRDPDDQKFIDLAVAHQARLFSKDSAVLKTRRPLARLGVEVLSAAQYAPDPLPATMQPLPSRLFQEDPV